MKHYKNYLALDFEMYNAMRYYSVCWIGALFTDAEMNPVEKLDVKVNPDTRHKLVGKELKFPFTYKDLKVQPKFDKASRTLFKYLNIDTLVVGHAVDNDIKMLMSACAHYGLQCPDFDYIDTLVVYGALNGSYAQVSLTSLAQKYGVEFSPHDPSQDAFATLCVLKRMLEESGETLQTLADKHALCVGKVRGGLVRKCTADCMVSRAREHIDNYNAVFDAANETASDDTSKPLGGKKIALDLKLMTSQNLYDLVKWIVESGGKIVYEPHGADFTLTGSLIEGDEKNMRLVDFAGKYKLPESVRDGLDFYPNKVVLKSGETCSFSQYLKSKAGVNGSGGTAYCFVRGIERRFEFEQIACRVLASGNRICTMPDKRAVLVIDSQADLKDTSDIKVRKFAACGAKRTVTLDELKKSLRGD